MQQFVGRNGVVLRPVVEQAKHWDYKAQGLTQGAAAFIMLAVSLATQGIVGPWVTSAIQGMGLAGTAAGKALEAALMAGMKQLAGRAAVALINNQGDIGAALKELGSDASIKSLATTMLTAGLTASLPADILPTAPAGGTLSLTERLQANIVRGAIGAAVGSAIQGGKFGDKFADAMISAAVDTIGAEAAMAIGTAAAKGDITHAMQLVAHAALGCGMGAALNARSGNAARGCAGGAVGGVVGEVVGTEWLERQLQAGNIDAIWDKQGGIDLARLAGGLAALLVGADVNAASLTAGNAAENNALAKAGITAVKVAAKILRRAVRKGHLSLKDIREAGLDELYGVLDDVKTLADPSASMLDKAIAVLELGTGVGKDEIRWFKKFWDGLGGSAQTGRAIRAAKLALNRKRGEEFEKAVLEQLKAAKNNKVFEIRLPDGRIYNTIPDAICGIHGVVECKNVSYLTRSDQLRAQMRLAREQGRPFTLVVSTRTRLSGTLRKELETFNGEVRLMRFDLETKTLMEVPLKNSKR